MSIQELIENKKIDKGTPNNPNLLEELLTEYINTMSELSGLPKEFLINKMNSLLDTIRFGDFKEEDSNIKYDQISVTSPEFKEKYRKKDNGFGAINIFNNGNVYICLFDNSTGLSGIDLNNIDDIKHTLYHELTHLLEKGIVNGNNILDINGSKVVIGDIDTNKNSIDEYKNSNNTFSSGLETVEFKPDGTRIIHNQISEGATELITRMILNKLGIKINNKDRYIENVIMAEKIFNLYGVDALRTYITDSSKIISFSLNKSIDDTNLLFYGDNYTYFVREQAKDLTDLSIVPNYIKYQTGEKTDTQLLSNINDNDKIIIKKIIDYKNKPNRLSIKKNNESFRKEIDRLEEEKRKYEEQYLSNINKTKGI